MTEITATEAFKSKAKFEEFISNSAQPQIESILAEYPENTVVCKIVDFTQNIETLLNSINEFHELNPYIIWIVSNPKTNLMKAAEFFNRTRIRNVGIFVFQATLNNEEIEFKCLLKPKKNIKSEKNQKTPAGIFNKNYWEKYFEICDALMSDMQIKPSDRHFQTISIKKSGVQIMQTTNKSRKLIASEIYINDNKELFDKLFEHREEIENEAGEIIWLRLDDKKASRIIKSFSIDIENPENLETAITEHVAMAESLKTTFSKYL